MFLNQGRKTAGALFALSIGSLVLLLAALAGCGGGEEVAEETVPRLNEKQLTRKMSAVCQEHTERQVLVRENWQKKEGLPPAEDAGRKQLERELVVVILPIVRDTIHDLHQLHPAQKQEATFKEFIAALEHGVAYSEKDPSWLVTGTEEPFSEARELSWKLGTALCGQA
jgi:hypothetical protein